MYGVSAFIEKCAESLMRQTLEDVEFIFVNDATKDDSVSVLKRTLERYPERIESCRVIEHPVNKGLPSARNTGLEMAEGEYVFHCDGDDWMEPDMLEKLYAAAEEKSADMVWCDFYISFEQNERIMKARDYKTVAELMHKGFMCGDMKYNVWNKMVRRSLYVENGIRFPDGHSMGEDMTMIKLAACTIEVAYVPCPLYHYLKTNAGAYTQTMSERHLTDIRYNVDDVTAWLENRFPGQYTEDINLFKLNIKLPFLLASDVNQLRLWKDWYPESNGYIFRNSELPLRTKMLQWMAAKNLWFGVRLYYALVYKFVYGILYK